VESQQHVTGQAERPASDLLYEGLIRGYVSGNPRFVARPGLAARVRSALADAGCRFVLRTAEPGAGKTALMAWLARQHPTWPRYVIRRDQRGPLDDVGAHSLLLRIGFQLAAAYPTLFMRDQVTLSVEQRLGRLGQGGAAVGVDVDKLLASPFYQTTLAIRQHVESSTGNVIGVRIGQWVTDPRLVPLSDLQFMALLEPAQALLRTRADEQLVVLVDALDELRYRDTTGTDIGMVAAACGFRHGNLCVAPGARLKSPENCRMGWRCSAGMKVWTIFWAS